MVNYKLDLSKEKIEKLQVTNSRNEKGSLTTDDIMVNSLKHLMKK